MELKWKECFIPQLIQHFGLQGVSKYAREAAEFVNLYSKDRGCNRFIGLIKSLDLLRERPEVAARGYENRCELSDAFRSWVGAEKKLGEPAMAAEVERTKDGYLAQCLDWSRDVNRSIAQMVEGVPPFPMVRESLQRLGENADMIVCSGTPTGALKAEWEEHKIDQFVQQIFGQEAGKKAEVLSRATTYDPDKRLMIGDAPGDHQAAQAADCLFFPINPGEEETSWRKLHHEGIDRFLTGRFAGDFQQQILEEFETYLPEHPPWTAEK